MPQDAKSTNSDDSNRAELREKPVGGDRGGYKNLREGYLRQLYRQFDFGTQDRPYIDYGHKKR